MTTLPNDIESLKALIVPLLKKIAQLEAENAELRRRLGVDSSNSDKPPSSEPLVLKDFTGTTGHDRWLPYFNFGDARHVLCSQTGKTQTISWAQLA